MSNFAVDLSILWPALIAGLLVMLSHVPLGQQVLKRGIVFIDLAIAQVAALGVIAAHTFGHELSGWTTQFAAVAAALAGSLLERPTLPSTGQAVCITHTNPKHLAFAISTTSCSRFWRCSKSGLESSTSILMYITEMVLRKPSKDSHVS